VGSYNITVTGKNKQQQASTSFVLSVAQSSHGSCHCSSNKPQRRHLCRLNHRGVANQHFGSFDLLYDRRHNSNTIFEAIYGSFCAYSLLLL
jgi:hypothetical protein